MSFPTTTTKLVRPRPVAQVSLQRAQIVPTPDQALWVVIRNSAESINFEKYSDFIDRVMSGIKAPTGGPFDRALKNRHLPFPDVEPYRLLKVATEVFLMAYTGVAVGSSGLLDVLTDKRNEDAHPLDLGDIDFANLELDPAVAAEEKIRLNSDTSDLDYQWTAYLQDVGGYETVPYLHDIIKLKLADVPILPDAQVDARKAYSILRSKLTQPVFLELIWNYWHEEGMLVQTMNAISWRFQNRRGSQERDPLAALEIDPLRRLNNLLWGWVQDEQHRLTIPRRAYEYDHEYGLKLMGKAVPAVRGADSRSRFLEGFHTLLMLCSVFYKEDDDTTVVADGFPVLNGLRDVHLQLTQGAHNQFGDLPWTARQEFLMQEWLLARPEMREFLPRRIMVDYPEGWMDSVETMKGLQGWTPTSILHFRDLAIFGEKILLAIRFGAWTSQIHPESAANWARYWRPEIQGYIHAYRAATGVDLTDRVDATIPAVLLQRRLPARAGGRDLARTDGVRPDAVRARDGR